MKERCDSAMGRLIREVRRRPPPLIQLVVRFGVINAERWPKNLSLCVTTPRFQRTSELKAWQISENRSRLSGRPRWLVGAADLDMDSDRPEVSLIRSTTGCPSPCIRSSWYRIRYQIWRESSQIISQCGQSSHRRPHTVST